jgi:hypothetical protein
MIWLLSWLFPLAVMLPRARKLGSVSFTEVAGVGWQCTIRPPIASGQRRMLSSWHATAKTLGRALRDAVETAELNPDPWANNKAEFSPKLGGREFDPQ